MLLWFKHVSIEFKQWVKTVTTCCRCLCVRSLLRPQTPPKFPVHLCRQTDTHKHTHNTIQKTAAINCDTVLSFRLLDIRHESKHSYEYYISVCAAQSYPMDLYYMLCYDRIWSGRLCSCVSMGIFFQCDCSCPLQ